MKKTYERVIRPDQEGVAFPKKVRKRLKPGKKEVPESVIQSFVDSLLELNHIEYLRLPDNMFRAILSNRSIPEGVKAWVLSELSGWSDNIAFLPLCELNGVKFSLTCFIENKTESGTLRSKQKIKNRTLGYNVCRDEAKAKEIIDTFKRFKTLLSDILKAREAAKEYEKLEKPYSREFKNGTETET